MRQSQQELFYEKELHDKLKSQLELELNEKKRTMKVQRESYETEMENMKKEFDERFSKLHGDKERIRQQEIEDVRQKLLAEQDQVYTRLIFIIFLTSKKK